MKVTVFGATGMLGLPVTKALVSAGYEVTALVRRPQQIGGRLPAEVKVIEGDVTNPADVDGALDGADSAYLSLSVPIDARKTDPWVESIGVKHVVASAKKRGNLHVAYLSSLLHRYDAFPWWVFDMKREAVRTLQQSGVRTTIFYPSNFMETLPYRLRQGSRIALAGRARQKGYWICADDYGQQLVRALSLPHTGLREWVVQGPEPLTADEAARAFVAHYRNASLSVVHAPLWIFRLLGLFSPRFDYVHWISKAMNANPEPFQAQRTWAELGKPTTTVATFAASLRD